VAAKDNKGTATNAVLTVSESIFKIIKAPKETF
jgi:hypothetical protein